MTPKLRRAVAAGLFIAVVALVAYVGRTSRGSNSPLGSALAGAAPAAEASEIPFTPPSLEDLAKVQWLPQRVADSLKLLEDEQRSLAATDADLDAPNTSDAANAKIADALSRFPASPDEADWEAELIRHLGAEPKSLNVAFNSTRYETVINSILYAGPMGYDRHLQPLADAEVVTAWERSADGLMDRVVLRDDITWTDGKPFTAHDVEFSFNAIRSPKVMTPAVRTSLEPIKAVKAYDNRAVVYFHREPLATNIWSVNFPVLPKHIFQATLAVDPTMATSPEHAKLSRDPVTNGPYRLVSWTAGQDLVLERRPEWYEKEGKRIRAKPYFKTIRFRILSNPSTALLAFRKGEIDEIELNAEQWMSQTSGADFAARGVRVRGEEFSFYFIVWNQRPVPDAPFFKDRRVREAMSLALPHAELIQEVLGGLHRPGAGPYHPQAWAGDASIKPLSQDLRAAQRLLAEAGWKDTDSDGVLDLEVNGKKVPFRFTLTIPSGNPLYVKVASLLQASLKKLRVVCDTKELEFTTLQTKALEHDFHALTMGISSGTDPFTAENLFRTDAYKDGRNWGGYSNPRVDELFKGGQRELDFKKRAAIYQEIHRLIWADQPMTFLAYKPALHAVSRDLRGFKISPRGPFGYSGGLQAIWKKKTKK